MLTMRPYIRMVVKVKPEWYVIVIASHRLLTVLLGFWNLLLSTLTFQVSQMEKQRDRCNQEGRQVRTGQRWCEIYQEKAEKRS